MVNIIGTVNASFEGSYLAVREKEGRVYSDEKVATLPYLTATDPHFKEWQLRIKTLDRFLPYLADQHKNGSLLEIGCGNGWFSSRCAKEVAKVAGVDVNLSELEQGSRVFKRENLSFYYWDIFTASPFQSKFDCIVLNAVVQYFPNFEGLIRQLKTLLNPKGEIHILDSPFYSKEEVHAAKQRSDHYYANMGVPEMSAHYFHHQLKSIEMWDVLFSPKRNRFVKLLKGHDSPFAWYRLSC